MLLPQQSSSSTREEESQWSAQERTAIASPEKAWKESRGTKVEDKRKRCVAFEDAARRMLNYLEDSEDLKVGLSELKEQLEMPEEAGFSIMQIAQQARDERCEKALRNVQARREWRVHRQLGEVGCTMEWIGGAGKALSGLDAGGETAQRKSRNTDWHGGEQEDMQKEAPQKYQGKVFGEFSELEEQEKPWNSCKRRICSSSGKARGKQCGTFAKIGRMESDKTLE